MDLKIWDEELYKLKTPCYLVNEKQFIKNLNTVKNSFSELWLSEPVFGYSVKTNHLSHLLTLAKENDMLAEVVSDDEYCHAVKCGYSHDQIIFNGPQKSNSMLLKALSCGAIVNLDNFSEIIEIQNNIHKLPVDKLKVGLRVNFDLEKKCPGETTAGGEVSRFGFCYENNDLGNAIKSLNEMGINISGLHLHFSSKTRSKAIFKSLSKQAGLLIKEYDLNEQIKYIDIGGGFFLGEQEVTEGKPTMKDYASAVCEPLMNVLDSKKVKLILEPGAALISTAVNYLCRVINTRNVRGVRIVTTNGSLIHINPFMAKRNQPADVKYAEGIIREKNDIQIVCGATCMENDRMLYLKNEPSLVSGDCILFRCAGAYTMGFNNCFINLPPYIYRVSDKGFQLIRNKNSEIMSNI